MVGKYHRETRERLQVEAAEILEQLVYCATRSGADFCDEDGRLIQNVHDMPVRAQQAIDGIKQKVRKLTYEDGTEVEEV